MRRALVTLLPLMLLVGCGSAATGSAPATPAAATVTPTTTATATTTAVVSASASSTTITQSHRHAAPKPPTAIRVVQTTYGRALVDHRGFALYLFTRDPHGRTTCRGACAAAWPPYVVRAPQLAAQGEARTGLVGTIRRAGGGLQVTYRGHPLYYYVGDRQPHQVLCQAVTEFGGTWYVVRPDGSPIR